jgi:hypothetical protein
MTIANVRTTPVDSQSLLLDVSDTILTVTPGFMLSMDRIL